MILYIETFIQALLNCGFVYILKEILRYLIDEVFYFSLCFGRGF